MASAGRPDRLAVLIDADNASAKIVEGLFEEIATLGEASVRRIYGDFSKPNLKSWADVLSKYAILATQQFANTTGKNSSDITLVIEAMDLLHSGRFDGFCLVSSDSDFTRLAQRIREEGVDVFGFGEQKTPESFRQACRRFIYTENLVSHPSVGGDAELRPLEPLAKAESAILGVISEIEPAGGWVYVGHVVVTLRNRAPDFDWRTYGYKTFNSLVQAIPKLELHLEEGRWNMRKKPNVQTPSAKKAPAKAAQPKS